MEAAVNFGWPKKKILIWFIWFSGKLPTRRRQRLEDLSGQQLGKLWWPSVSCLNWSRVKQAATCKYLLFGQSGHSPSLLHPWVRCPPFPYHLASPQSILNVLELKWTQYLHFTLLQLCVDHLCLALQGSDWLLQYRQVLFVLFLRDCLERMLHHMEQ